MTRIDHPAANAALGFVPEDLSTLDMPVQGKGTLDGPDVHSVASRGVAGVGGTLPHLHRIQTAFGDHDISGVRAHVAGGAAEASAEIGASAYTTGNDIAFASAPDLHLAAHEAAHVVQQRSGVQLSNGMGQPGDAHEQHADQVAAAVVRGESAAPLLDRYTGRGGGRVGVQKFNVEQTQEEREAEARGVLRRLASLSEEEQRRRIGAWSSNYSQELLAAISEEDRETYAEIVERITGERATSSNVWGRFAIAFARVFPSDVVALFGGEQVTGTSLQQAFTPAQRDNIWQFIYTGQIPDRLFNGGDVASPPAQAQPATARQRIMVSAHILTTGTYTNRQHEQQRVEARNCGHFVSLVNAYAGVGSERAMDVRGNFDHRGDVVLHAGQTGRATHSPGEGNLPMNQFDTIQPGDWLYIRARINHSVIFGAWIDETPRSVQHQEERYRYRRAITYDQLHNNRGEGGLRHMNVRIGDRILRRADGARFTIYAITRVEPPQEANVATTPEDLVPDGGNPASVEEANRRLLEENDIPVEEAVRWVRTENASLIHVISAPRSGGTRDSRTSPEQVRLLEETNSRDDLEMLIHLNERLQRLADGVAFLENAEEADRPRTYSEDSRAPEDRRAPSGYNTSAGRRGGYDTTRERATTGRLQNVRRPLPGISARGRSRRSRRRLQERGRRPRPSGGGERSE